MIDDGHILRICSICSIESRPQFISKWGRVTLCRDCGVDFFHMLQLWLARPESAFERAAKSTGGET